MSEISRRDFLKKVAILGGSLALSRIPGSEAIVTPEKPKPSILIIDFFDTELLQKTEGDETKQTLIEAVKNYFRDHGNKVDEVRQKAAGIFNIGASDAPIIKASITDAVNFGEVTYDHENNPNLEIIVDREVISQKIAESNASIVSMSIELGKTKMKDEINYWGTKTSPELNTTPPIAMVTTDNQGNENFFVDGKEISKEEYSQIIEGTPIERELKALDQSDRKFVFKDGYFGENTYENLRQLAELARKFPNKFFIAAAGNPFKDNGEWKFPNIKDATEKLKGEGLWSENLLTVGVFGGDYKTTLVTGADIYVDSEDLFGFQPAASFATPVISEAVRKIMSLGHKDPKEIKEILFSVSDTLGQEERFKFKVLNVEKAKEIALDK